jgi:predicted enzyme related to lactoylglutathione lyase
MNQGIKLVVYPVSDLARAKALYGRLAGGEPYADAPYYVGYRFGDLEVGLDPNGQVRGTTGALCYWEVDDLRSELRALLDAGAQVQQDVTDVGGGRIIATLKDADGNVIGLMQSP